MVYLTGADGARTPPANIQAEQALLGALLANNRATEKVSEFLEPKHFAEPVHGVIYDAIRQNVARGAVADAITLKARFEHSGDLDPMGGIKYLAQLLTAMIGIVNAATYGRTIRETWERRQLIALGTDLVNEAYTAEPADLAASISLRLDEATAATAAIRPAVDLDTALDAVLAHAERAFQNDLPVGLSSGLRGLDAIIGGLEPGTVTVLAGRPAMGKTAAGLGIALSAARTARASRAAGTAMGGVAFISLEMSSLELARRTLASAAGISVSDIKRARDKLTQPCFDKLITARRELTNLPLSIDDAAGLTMAMIRLKLRSMRRSLRGLSLIVLDHLHLVRPEDSDVKNGATFAVGRISNKLKVLAKDFDCPVLALAQLNRGVEGRDDKRPSLADLRQAGEIEQDADCVMFVYRAEYYLREPERGAMTSEGYHAALSKFNIEAAATRGRAEIIVAKLRDGEPGTAHLSFDGPTASFRDIGNTR